MRIALSAILCFIMVMLSAGPAAGDATSYLPVSHRVYDFLDRMEHLEDLPGALLGAKPLTRAEAAKYLFSISTDSDWLTNTDIDELNYLRAEFKNDFLGNNRLSWDNSGPVEHMPGFLSGFVYRNRRNLYSSNGDNYSLYFDPVVVREGTLGKDHATSEDDNVYTFANGLKIRGTVGEHLGFHIDVRDSKEFGSRDYSDETIKTMPGRGWVTSKEEHVEFDETSAHLAYSNGPFAVMYGRGKNVWGRGHTGTLALSEYSSPYDMFRIETSFWKLKFIFFAAEIEQQPPVANLYYNDFLSGVSDSVMVKKRMTGHRIELGLTDRINVGLYENVVYGGRWDWSYLNPVMFLKGAEHNNGDHDNAAMGMDFRVMLHHAHSLYGEFFIDDITTTKLGTDWYGNKLAYQLGTFLVMPFGLKDVDTRIEYTRIKPWVYTNRIKYNSYTHYGDVIGYPLGPNSDEIFMQIRKRFSRRFHTSLSFARRRHGANPDGANIGGDPLVGYKDGDSKKAKFLAGDLENSKRVSIDMSYEIFWELFLKIGYSYDDLNGDSTNIYRVSFGLNQ
ncbi:capsule assembly Wzi family protein [Candidatus Latescibacterota bacterium]